MKVLETSYATRIQQPPREPGISSPHSREGLLWLGPREFLPAGRMIYAEADDASFIYRVALGMVSTSSVTRNGGRVVRGFHVAGDVFGVERENVHSASAETVGDVHLQCCERTRFQKLAASDNLIARQLWEWLLASAERAERLALLGRRSAVEKVAYFLVDLAGRLGAPGRLELPMSRTDIGDYLGLSSETVSRTFTVLRGKGLIATEGRFVVLVNTPGLRQINRNLPGRSHL